MDPANDRARNEDSKIVRAHEFFECRIKEWLAEETEDRQARVVALELAITVDLQLVVISLESNEDAHVIFETLNARGTPLLQAELVKNLIMYEAARGDGPPSPDTSDLWFHEDDWWEGMNGSGMHNTQHPDAFLNNWLILRTTDEVKTGEIFRRFGRYLKESRKPVAEVAADIKNMAEIYRKLEDAKSLDPVVASFVSRWKVMKIRQITPVVLWLVASEVSEQHLTKTLCALESYLVRRMLCGKYAKKFGPMFLSLVKRLAENSAENAGDAVVEFLSTRPDNQAWPTDRDLADAFQKNNFMSTDRKRMVLEALEKEMRTSKTESRDVPPKLTIEHIMPVEWHEHWPLPGGATDLVEGVERDAVLNSIGNLTLLTQRMNSSIKNGPWKHKRTEIWEHSRLFLNREIVHLPIWDEQRIRERAGELCEVAKRVWPSADNFQKKAS